MNNRLYYIRWLSFYFLSILINLLLPKRICFRLALNVRCHDRMILIICHMYRIRSPLSSYIWVSRLSLDLQVVCSLSWMWYSLKRNAVNQSNAALHFFWKLPIPKAKENTGDGVIFLKVSTDIPAAMGIS